MMVDHILLFADEATARAAIPQYWTDYGNGDGSGDWRLDICNPGISVYTVDGETRTYFDSWGILIALTEVDETLRGLPACRVIFDRDAAAARQPYVLYAADGVDGTVIGFEPWFAGSDYPV